MKQQTKEMDMTSGLRARVLEFEDLTRGKTMDNVRLIILLEILGHEMVCLVVGDELNLDIESF